MAKSKMELLDEARAMGLELDDKAKVADTKAAIEQANSQSQDTQPEEIDNKAETAKAGKRSAKSQKEAAEKQAKEERKTAQTTGPTKEKPAIQPTRSRLERRSKAYRLKSEEIDKTKQYSLEEAISTAQKTSSVKFDATVELHIRLGVDPRHADQNIRDNITLPSGTGKSVKIAVLSEDSAAAKKAGADIAGSDDLLAAFDKGEFDFDILIATPAMMPKLGKYARVLGPKGLMPNPKSGTVTNDIAKAVGESKAGKVEYRVDSTGIIHLGIGKVSFSANQLVDNAQAVLSSVKSNKPSSLKGNYFKAIHVTTTMGPSISVDVANIA